MRTTLAVVQARMGSTRFPGKSLTPIWGDVSLLGLVLIRLAKSCLLDGIILATSDQPQDNPLVEVAEAVDIPAFRGHESDVLTRFCDATDLYPADAIIRVCGDNPLIDPDQVDALIEFFWNRQPCHYACNDRLNCGLPDGSGAEIISSRGLEMLNDAVVGEMREHVSAYATLHPELFSLRRLKSVGPLRRPEVRLDVDYPQDARFIRELIGKLNPANAPFWSTLEVIEALDCHPELSELRREHEDQTVPVAE